MFQSHSNNHGGDGHHGHSHDGGSHGCKHSHSGQAIPDFGPDMKKQDVGNMMMQSFTNMPAGQMPNARFPSLIEAVTSGTPQDVMLMVMQNPAAVNMKGWHGLTPLHKATLRGDTRIIHMLFRLNADPNAQNEFEETPLMFACRTGNIAYVHLLLERGAELNAVDKVGRGAVLHACVSGSVATLHYLSTVCNLSFQVKDANGLTPLHILCSHGHLEAVKYLLKNERSDPQMQDEFGNIAMHYACKNGNSLNVWNLLKVAGYRLLHSKNHDGMTPLDYADQHKNISNEVLSQKLKPLMSVDKSSYPRGPLLSFYWKVVMPFVAFGSLAVVLPYVLPESQGLAMLIGVSVIMYKIWSEGHRMKDISQWPCPSQLGGYFGGQLQLILCFFIRMVPILYNNYYLMIPVVVLTPIYLYLCILIPTKDPGIVNKSAVKDSVSGEYTMRDIAIGIVPPQRFCTECEIIQPSLTKHCRLCRHCVRNMDHHCLFFMRCIGERNHCAFVHFTIISVLSGLWFLACVYNYGLTMYSGNFLMSLFSKEGWIMGCVYLAVITIIMSSYVFKWQLTTISKGETWAFFSRAPVSGLTAGEEILNVFYFLAGKKCLKQDPLFDAENPRTVCQQH